MIARHKGQELSDDELKEAFSVFDVDDIGFITGVCVCMCVCVCAFVCV